MRHSRESFLYNTYYTNLGVKNVKLISWNVNGLRAVEKKGFLDFLNTCHADILALQETKALPEQLSDALRAPSGWHSYFCSAERKGYSGVAVYSKQEPLQVWYGLGNEEFDKEDCILNNFLTGKSGGFRINYPNLVICICVLQQVRPRRWA